MQENRRDRMNELLDLLAEEVAHRLRAELQPQVEPSDRDQEKEVAVKRPQATGRHPELARSAAQHEPELDAGAAGEPESEALKQESRPEPPPAPTVPPHIARLLGRLALGLLALVIVINIPINRHGTTLATAMPDRRALVIRDGLVLKEEDDPEIYVYRNGRFRWISSLKAFEMRGYTWQDVHIVEDGFLESFETGPPIHVILKCNDSPHVYRLEGEKKRWIVDIESFEAEGYVWEDVEFVSCDYLRDLPDGKTIPPGHGPPPQP